MFGASSPAPFCLLAQVVSLTEYRKKLPALVRKLNALAVGSNRFVKEATPGEKEQKTEGFQSLPRRRGWIEVVRPPVGREVLEGAQLIACCVRLVKAMLGEPGDALRLRELKAKGQNVEFPTKETEETRDPRGS